MKEREQQSQDEFRRQRAEALQMRMIHGMNPVGGVA